LDLARTIVGDRPWHTPGKHELPSVPQRPAPDRASSAA
jgi:hypothetical protein